MLKDTARLLGALILGASLAMPLAALAQGKSPTGGPTADPASPATTSPVPPTTAPTRAAGKVPGAPEIQQPAVQSPPAAGQGSTAVPGWNNPPQSWGGVSERPQYASIPGVETNRLIQGAGREWRAFHNGPLTQAGGWIIVLALAVLVVIYLVKGQVPLHEPPTGRLIERFNAVERASHWTMAISFIFLALTGIVMFFGKHIVLPWLGYSGFSWLTIVSKNIHNFVGPLFIFSLLVSFLVFVKDNLLRSYDWVWIRHFGNMYQKVEVPSARFNGMEKIWFWGGLVVLGATLATTGLILDFPNWNQTREAMQISNIVHVGAAMLFIAGGLAHAYMGTLGVEGAYRAMRRGYVDEAWARQHHALWYEEVRQGRRPERLVGPAPIQPVAGDD
ncbi:MAG TPA: formate dehydrogenase subunit gamma [Usitatibacter sp.]|nr:formate dehydrogenase subunit gamma [Usitatibacter sp.]